MKRLLIISLLVVAAIAAGLLLFSGPRPVAFVQVDDSPGEGVSLEIDHDSLDDWDHLKSPDISLPVADGTTLVGKAQYVRRSKKHTSISGKLTGRRPGKFYLEISKDRIFGLIEYADSDDVVRMRQDASGPGKIEELKIGDVICSRLPGIEAEATPSASPVISNAVALSDVPILNGNASSSNVVYLDFDGQTVSGTYWNGGATIVALPYDIDGDTTTFNDTELSRIQGIWQRVCEDYRPFDVNVTTDESVYLAAAENKRIRCVLTITSSWYGAVGGVALVGGFTITGDTPCWVFTNNLGGGAEKYCAEAASHEVGHTFTLRHDGQLPGTEYYQGHGSGETGWAPIMGNGYYQNLVQWSKGEYASANNSPVTAQGYQDDDTADIAAIVGYRSDDHADTNGSASGVKPGLTPMASGAIGQSTDTDVFTFYGNGTFTITVSPNSTDPNLDVQAELFDSGGSSLGVFNPTDALAATVSHTVGSQQLFYLHISGTGKGDPLLTGYTDYGSLGEYSLTYTGDIQNTLLPTLESWSMDGDNAVLTLQFSENVYTDGSANDLVIGDVAVESFSANGGTASAVSLSGITKVSDSSYQLLLNTTGTGAGVETFTLRLKATEIYDAMGNALAEATPTIALVDEDSVNVEIHVIGNGNPISDGDDTPTATNDTDFGSVVVGNSIDRTFTIQNQDSGSLVLTGTPAVEIIGVHASDFSVTSQASTPVNGSGSTTFTVRFSPSFTGTREAWILIRNSDADESLYDFAIQGTGITPEIAISGNGYVIPDGDTSPNSTDHTTFASVIQGVVSTRTYTISNSGNGVLSVSGVSFSGADASSFSLTSSPAASIAAGNSSTFTVSFQNNGVGSFSATVEIANSDADENPYDFEVNASTTANTGPTAVAKANTRDLLVVANGSLVTLSGSGSTDPDNAPVTPMVYAWAYVSGPVSSPGPALTDISGNNMEMTFTPTVDGTYVYELTVNDGLSDGTDQVTVIVGNQPQIGVAGQTVTITDGDATPSSTDGTDFGSLALSATSSPVDFTISNTGSAELNLSSTTIAGTNAGDFAISASPSSTVTAGGNSTLSITCTPSAAGTRSAEVRITSNDPLTPTFNFAIQATGGLPEIAITGNSQDIANGDSTPSLDDHTDFANAAVSGATVTRSFIITNSGTNVLMLTGSTTVAIGGAHASDFAVISLPSTSIATSNGSIFQIRFDPSAEGLRTATVTIESNDVDEGTFTFSIQGTGTTTAPSSGGGGGGGCTLGNSSIGLLLAMAIALLIGGKWKRATEN